MIVDVEQTFATTTPLRRRTSLEDCDYRDVRAAFAGEESHIPPHRKAKNLRQDLLDGLEQVLGISNLISVRRSIDDWCSPIIELFNVRCSDLIIKANKGLINASISPPFIHRGTQMSTSEILLANLIVQTATKAKKYHSQTVGNESIPRGPI